MLIFISIIIGIIIFYKVVIPWIHNRYHSTVNKKITKGLLAMVFWQLLIGSLICAHSLEVHPTYKEIDESVNSLLQEYSEIGKLVNEYTGIDASSNFNYLVSEANRLHTHAIIFMVISVILALITATGSISGKLDRRIVEALAILNTFAYCWICKSCTDFSELAVTDGATIQTLNWIGRLLGVNLFVLFKWSIRILWILPLILIVKHFFYHKTLDAYYALPIVSKVQPKHVQPTKEVDITETTGLVTKSSLTTDQQSKETKPEIVRIEESNKKTISFNIILLCTGVIAISIVAFFIGRTWNKEEHTSIAENQMKDIQYSDNNISIPDIYEQRSNIIIQELTSKYKDKIQVEHKYPELSKYCTFRLKDEDGYGFRYLLIYDLDKEELKQFDVQNLQTTNVENIFLATYSISINPINKKILISGDNGANSIGYTEYLLELDLSNWQIKEVCSGDEIIKNKDGYIATRRILTKWVDCVAMSEFANIDIHYDFDGNPVIPPFKENSYQLKGMIDNKYAVTMLISIQDKKIYGKYYYDKNGSDHFLYLYGGISDGGDVVLLEFNHEKQQTSNFKGQFTGNAFYGTFTNYKQIKMPFELCLDSSNAETISF